MQWTTVAGALACQFYPLTIAFHYVFVPLYVIFLKLEQFLKVFVPMVLNLLLIMMEFNLEDSNVPVIKLSILPIVVTFSGIIIDVIEHP